MLRASMRGWQPGRLRSLLVGLFLLGSFLATLGLSENTSVAQVKKNNPKNAKAKEEANKDAPPKWPDPIKLTLFGKNNDPQDLATLTEMVSVINKRTEEKWKENK